MNHRQRFAALDRLLLQTRPLWHVRSFEVSDLPWRQHWPELAQWLETLSDAQLDLWEQQEHAGKAALQQQLPLLAQLDAWLQLPTLPPLRSTEVDERQGYQVPGRKWQQIQAFVACVPTSTLPILEWCAGKGHLGRLAGGLLQASVTSLELDPQLCLEGTRLAQRQSCQQRFVALDVLSSDARQYLLAQQQAYALHACGDLHLQLLREAATRAVDSLYLSPCCYHRSAQAVYQPLSSAGQASSLRLQRQDLQLAVQETVTAGQRVQRLRQREVVWRLGFDQLQRQLRDCDEYLNVPSVQKSLLMGSFEDFCRWAAAQKNLHLPNSLDYAFWEAQGVTRQRLVRRLELVSHSFRRALEVWLVLDRALFLEERGYEVKLGEFCAAHLTPRNLMIQARLCSPSPQPSPTRGEGAWRS